MKSILPAAAVLLLALSCGHAGLIAQWNFNSTTPDNSTTTGVSTPSFGTGSAALVGGATATFASGSTNDPAASDNSAWDTKHFPSQGISNKTAGAQFNVSTLGYSNIV